MPWLKWLPWRFLVRRAARASGFLDPIGLMARLQAFAQPSEVAEPIELLRAGAIFHARGLINSRVIQHNLDWVWPYWVERQFDPRDDAFLPRAFSITHVNLTHRNWTAVGLPDCEEFPLVDPRGLVTPFFDGWSLDAWVFDDDGACLLPSRAPAAEQILDLEGGPAVVTRTAQDGLRLAGRAWAALQGAQAECHLRLAAASRNGGWLVLALRPYNPEGVSFIHEVGLAEDRASWRIDGERTVAFGAPAERHHVSDYRQGDVAIHMRDAADQAAGLCDIGMVTAAAMFRLPPGAERAIEVTVPLGRMDGGTAAAPATAAESWQRNLAGACAIALPDRRLCFLYEAALHSLVLHAPGLVYPGPYTYKRFWFRDACFIVYAMLCAGLLDRAEKVLDRFVALQTAGGYFYSQEGEWDSNGEVLWIFHRFCEMAGRPPKPAWWPAIVRGARWIARRRLKGDGAAAHAGLLPAGFSAEHLGGIDYYYWDDFWSLGGLRAAVALARRAGEPVLAEEFLTEAEDLEAAIERSLAMAPARQAEGAIPASPYRRMDAGAIGSLAAGYPLQLWPPDEPRLLRTVEFLIGNCFYGGGFFQDMTHSGINAYLTLHVAQVLLRAGDPRAMELVEAVAGLASPTGQWPEAIHPRTLGGCMGDGQHIWAAAEWVTMLRNCFLREEGDRLVLLGGIPPAWLDGAGPGDGGALRFGPAPTSFGSLSLTVAPEADNGTRPRQVTVSWQARWHGAAPPIDIRLPGFAPVAAAAGASSAVLSRVAP